MRRSTSTVPPTFAEQPRGALVVGGAKGIGRAIAHALAARGDDVVVADVVGTAAAACVRELRAEGPSVRSVERDVTDVARVRATLAAGAEAVGEAVDWLLANFGKDVRAASAGAVPFLKLMGVVAGGWQMARAALVAEQRLAAGAGDKPFYEAKIATARFFGDYLLTQAVSRIYLDNLPHIGSSWVTQGKKIGQVALGFGADDLGSVMIEENVGSAAGTTNRTSAAEPGHLIRSIGKIPGQPDTP